MKNTFYILLILFCSCGNKTFESTKDINKTGKDFTVNLNQSKESMDSINVSNETKRTFEDSVKCNISIIRRIDENLNSLTKQEVRLFFSTFSKDCSSNIEYSEYSNEMLYKVLEKYPSETIGSLASFGEEKISHILSEFANPLLDINGPKIKALIRDTQGDSKIKERLLKVVDMAME